MEDPSGSAWKWRVVARVDRRRGCFVVTRRMSLGHGQYGSRLGVSIVVALCTLTCFAVAPTSAQDSYAGQWQAGALQIRHQVESWGNDCGMRPPPTARQPGGVVTVAQNGDQLRFSGSVRGATNQCWSDKPSIRRISSRFQAGTWTTVCRTPGGDAQPEDGRYTFRVDGDRLVYREVTTWDWRLRESHCLATRTASRTLTRVSGTGVAPDPEPDPEPQPQCTAGEPSRIRIIPNELTIEPGARGCVRARVVDAAGCAIRNAPVRYELRPSTATLEGRCIQAADEGVYRIVARSGELRATAEIVVQSEDLSELTARRVRKRGGEPGLSDAESANAGGVFG